jgi:hypothetical protein
LYATVIDRDAAIHIVKLPRWLVLTDSRAVRQGRIEPVDLLPGMVNPAAGQFSRIPIGAQCSFIGPVFGTADEAAKEVPPEARIQGTKPGVAGSPELPAAQ